jgi:hypothetical protein
MRIDHAGVSVPSMNTGIPLRLLILLFIGCLTLALTGCGTPRDEPPPCVANLDAGCQPLYDPPVYATIFDKILQPTCAQGTGTCHTADGAKAGLVFENADTAYALLLGSTGGRVRVIPKDPACSLLVIRLESGDPGFRMPPGPTPLLDSELCDVVQWIAGGAQR